MKHFLLVFERTTGRLLRNEGFEDAGTALAERFGAERLHRDNTDIEVVVLTAESAEALRRTHGRYFRTLSDLASGATRSERDAGAARIAGV